MDKWVFWGVLLGTPIIWIIFLIANILTFVVFWSICCLVNLLLSAGNLIGYWKCNKDYQKKLKGLLNTANVLRKV